MNKVIISLIKRRVPTKVITQKVNDKAWFNKSCVNAFHNKQIPYRFPVQWRTTSTTPIPKGNSRPISITPIASKVYEKFFSQRFYKFFDSINVLPITQFGFRKGLGTTAHGALLLQTHDLQSFLDKFYFIAKYRID